jgi:hypothetical protein
MGTTTAILCKEGQRKKRRLKRANGKGAKNDVGIIAHHCSSLIVLIVLIHHASPFMAYTPSTRTNLLHSASTYASIPCILYSETHSVLSVLRAAWLQTLNNGRRSWFLLLLLASQRVHRHARPQRVGRGVPCVISPFSIGQFHLNHHSAIAHSRCEMYLQKKKPVIETSLIKS